MALLSLCFPHSTMLVQYLQKPFMYTLVFYYLVYEEKYHGVTSTVGFQETIEVNWHGIEVTLSQN